MPKKEKPKTVAEYINTAPKEAQKKLREIRACLRKTAPKAEESLKWGMPAFSHKRILFAYAGFKHHIGFYPTPSAVRAFAKDLSEFKAATVPVLSSAAARSLRRPPQRISRRRIFN